MDIIVTFFRDILDGPLYIIVALLSGFFFCACIGYLAEKSQLKKQAAANENNPQQQNVQPQMMAQPIHQSQAATQSQTFIQPQSTQPSNIPVQSSGVSNNNVPQ